MIHQFHDIKKKIQLTCDVCVVGSGAGGSTVAKELAEAGLDVVLLEEGGYFKTNDFLVDNTIQSFANLYRHGGGGLIFGKPNLILLEGRCVGGGTTVNGGMCWRTPEKIMKRWQWEYGLNDFTQEKMEVHFKRVEEIIQAKSIIPEASNRDSELLKKGAEKLGYRIRENMRAQDTCVGTNLCTSGCPTGAKQATVLSYIPKFIEHGGQLYSHCQVTRVLTKGNRAVGVEGHFINPITKKPGHKIKVKSKIVIVCGGAIQTPALLLRSGIRDQNRFLGKNLLVHPHLKVMATFNEKVNAWKGVVQGYQITEFFDEGIVMAVNFAPPGIAALALPLQGGKLMHVLKEEYHHMVMGGVLIEDTGYGQVKTGPFGTIIPSYQLNYHDFNKILRGVALLCEVFFAAGAKKCYLPFAKLPEIHTVDDISKIFHVDIKPVDLEILTVHIMGTAKMGVEPNLSVVNPHGEMHHMKGLFIADASVFPTSIGVNPQVTIMALANKTAHYILNHFREYQK